MNSKRLVLAGAVLLILAVAGIGAWLVMSIDGIVAREIERAGSDTTGTTVSVAGVNVKLKKGAGTIRSLRVANPKMFSPAKLLTAEAVTFDLDLDSIQALEPLVIDEVVVSNPQIRFEINADNMANLDVVAKHAAAAGGPTDPDPTLVRINRFVIRNAKVEADATAVVAGKVETIALKDIVLTNLGGKKGATSDEISQQIVAAVQKEVMRAVAKEGFKRLLEGQEKELKTKVNDALKGLFRK